MPPPTRDPALVTLAGLAAYNLVQNLVISDRGYVPANLAATAALVAYARRTGASLDELGLAPARLPQGLATGAAAAMIAGAGVGAARAIPVARPWFGDDRARGHDRAEAVRRTLVRFPLGTALFEEVAFRGVLHGLWSRRSGPRTARRVTAAAFGAWHLVPTFRLWPQMAPASGRTPTSTRLKASVLGAVMTTVSGIGFGWMRERSRSVASPWLAHAAINSLSYLAARSEWNRRDGRQPGVG